MGKTDILPNIVTQHQNAFIPGLLITKNALIVFETFHTLNKTNKVKKGYVGIKLDMTKAH